MRFRAVVVRLTSVNVLTLICAAGTSPILARALGPAGRGEVAAIFALLTLGPWICDLGITQYLAREAAQGEKTLGELVGSSLPLAAAASLIAVCAAVPLAHLLGRGRSEVVDFLELGLFLMPFNVLFLTLSGVAVGLQHWNLVVTWRLLNTIVPSLAIFALAALGGLMVSTVAVVYLATGVIAVAPFAVELTRIGRLQFVPSVCAAAAKFGVRSWLATLATAGTFQLDQVLMAGMVSSRQLGLYALAVTLSGLTAPLIGAMSSALLPRVAAGDPDLAARACRFSVLFAVITGAVIAAVSPVAVPLIFGTAFKPAVPMLMILLPANLFAIAGQILSGALIAAGVPQAVARAQFAGLVVTVPGLLLLLPAGGGLAAAGVSLGAYVVVLALVFQPAKKALHTNGRALMVVKVDDMKWIRSALTAIIGNAKLVRSSA